MNAAHATLLSFLCAAMVSSAKEPGRLASLVHANAWLNSPPLTAADLHGKVVLVDFWTYTCINWRRTLPWLRAWDQKYRDKGLVIIGVHTPEFSFEKSVDNVRRAAREQKVDYPIAVDSDYAIWNAFGNRYWPALYFIDAQGRIAHRKFGEGDYQELEVTLQQLLAEAGQRELDRRLVAVEGVGAEAAADWESLQSPETYLRYANSVVPHGRSRPTNRNEWALVGDWDVRNESAVLKKPGGLISYRFHARDVHLVMSRAAGGTPIRFRVSIDGQPPGLSHGVDVDEAGNGTLDDPRMYQLIRQQGPIRDRQFDIEFLDADAEVFVFTFG